MLPKELSPRGQLHHDIATATMKYYQNFNTEDLSAEGFSEANADLMTVFAEAMAITLSTTSTEGASFILDNLKTYTLSYSKKMQVADV
jgi:hypothetical protein